MPLPALAQGLVVRYEYIWHREASANRTTAEKERPVCVTVIFDDPDEGRMVMLLPITHSPPSQGEVGIEIPQQVKKHLGLDAERSWIIVSECNIDGWPSPDLRQIPAQAGKFHYGYIPPRLFRIVREAFVSAYRPKKVQIVPRHEM